MQILKGSIHCRLRNPELFGKLSLKQALTRTKCAGKDLLQDSSAYLLDPAKHS
jgi:hypothetical protein